MIIYFKLSDGDCFEPLGMESGEILDSDISASTTYFLNYASNARLNNDKFWMPSANDNQQFLQVVNSANFYFTSKFEIVFR